MCTLAAILLLALQPDPPAPSARTAHIRIAGDLDTMRLAADVGAAFDDAARDRTALIVLQLDGNRARLDVAWAIAARIRDCPVPVTVYLADTDDGRVGCGQLLIGLGARSCWIAPGTTIAHTPADDLRALAPEDTDWERPQRELAGAAWINLNERGADPVLSHLLANPTESAWALPAESGIPARVATAPPPGGGRRFITAGADGLERVDIDADLAVSLGLARDRARSLSVVLAGEGRRGGTPTLRRTIRSGLADAARAMPHAADDLRTTIKKLETALKVRSTSDRPATAQDYRTAASKAGPLIDRAASILADADGAVATYSELSRLPQADAWADALKDARKDLDKLRATAADYASR